MLRLPGAAGLGVCCNLPDGRRWGATADQRLSNARSAALIRSGRPRHHTGTAILGRKRTDRFYEVYGLILRADPTDATFPLKNIALELVDTLRRCALVRRRSADRLQPNRIVNSTSSVNDIDR